jgi:hypothetical protein
MPPPLQGLKDFYEGLSLRLANPTSHPQSSVGVNHGGAPKLAAFLCLGIVFFLPEVN